MWSLIIRDKFNHTCIMCSKTKETAQIHGHHCLVSKQAGGNTARYHLENGVAMCYNCHINKLHGRQDRDFAWYESYVENIKQIFTQDKIDALRAEMKNTILPDKQLLATELKLKELSDEIKNKELS